MANSLLRSLPSIEKLLARPAAARLAREFPRQHVRDRLRQITEELRRELQSGNGASFDSAEALTEEIERRLEESAAGWRERSLRRVVNATGVVLHTNLGRAPLAREAIEAIAETAAGYSNLEYDLEESRRGRREVHCQSLLARLTGAESAIVVNNCAAAVMLVLNTLAEGGEVIVSRGELIEIGGSFRIPEILEKSGARLREVGTTNRTRIEDYERAISDATRLILRVHPSNYRIVGFTERPSIEAIADLARRAGVPSFEDLGSGCMLDLAADGITDEPVAGHSLRAGMSLIAFSGDKLLGGPQAGIIAGAAELVERVRRNPLMRALRVDKLTYAALEATLRIYERGAARCDVPVIRALTLTRDEIALRAADLASAIAEATQGRVMASLEEGVSMVGGGSAPEVRLPTVLVALVDGEMSAAALEQRLRRHSVPVIARTERDRVLIDLRTVAEGEESIILEALAAGAPASSARPAGAD